MSVCVCVCGFQHFEHWPKGSPICVHAEGRTTAAIILLASLNNRSVHICHVATRDEIEIVKAAKLKVHNSPFWDFKVEIPLKFGFELDILVLSSTVWSLKMKSSQHFAY